jgi:hypothetical protein
VVGLTLPSPFTLPQSRFNAFLFASVGTEGNGMTLSVVSALARLEIDPWQEAARLSELPRELAAAALDGLIRRLPAGRWDPEEIRTIAARLIELLPRPDAGARSVEVHPGDRTKSRPPAVIWLLVIALGAALLFSVLANGAQHANDLGGSTALTNAVRSSAQP